MAINFADRIGKESGIRNSPLNGLIPIVFLTMTVVTAPLPLSDDHPDELLLRTIVPPTQTSSELSFSEIYEIERTKRLLKEGNFRTVALQFPDDLLHNAAEVSKQLQDEMEGLQTYILADTSYGR